VSEERRDILQVRASAALRKFVKEMKDAGHVGEQVDAYRLCIAVAIAVGRLPDPERQRKGRDTMFAANTLDTDESALRIAISEMYPDVAGTPYRAAEDLAEQGAEILKNLWRDEEVRYTDVLDLAERGAESDGANDGQEPGDAAEIPEENDAEDPGVDQQDDEQPAAGRVAGEDPAAPAG
jgi:hypothetical protein